MSTLIEAPDKFRLVRSWRGCEVRLVEGNVTIVPLEDRLSSPLDEVQVIGDEMTLEDAHKKAEQLNKVQIASGYLDWLYSPIPADAEVPTYDKVAWEEMTLAY